MESRYSCKSFPVKKLNRRSLAVNSCSYLDGRSDRKYFFWPWLAEEIISVLCFFLRHGGIRAQQRIFLNVLRESAAKFA